MKKKKEIKKEDEWILRDLTQWEQAALDGDYPSDRDIDFADLLKRARLEIERLRGMK
jgi:hypothetical protein